MFRVNFALVMLMAAVVIVIAEEIELYSDKYDYINADDILANDRLRDEYYKCFLDVGPCITADAKYFKERFPESMVTQCKKCTEKQKENFGKIVEWYTKNRPLEWEALIKKYVHQK